MSTPHHLFFRRFLQNRSAVVSLLVLILFLACALAAPLLQRWMDLDPAAISLPDRFANLSLQHPLGTDALGRDVFLRVVYGGRVSLTVGLITAGLAALFGTAIGLIAGFYGGWVDRFLMRATDTIIALPLLPLLIILAAIDLQALGFSSSFAHAPDASLYRIVLIIALFGWTTVARLVRAGVLRCRELDYVRAARALGMGSKRIALVHILPNVAAPLIVATTLTVGNIILLESVLSFLGLGIQPPVPSWGNMLTGAQDLIWDQPLLTLWPGLAIFITVIAFNFLGDGLQDALDPRSQRENS